MGYAFISFSSKNQSYAGSLKELLTKNGIQAWLSSDDIDGGDNYISDITAAISSCDCLIVLLSKQAQESVWVSKEVETAMTLKKKVIPIAIDNEPLNDVFALLMKGCNIINLEQLTEKGQMTSRLLKAVRASIVPDTGSAAGDKNKNGSDNSSAVIPHRQKASAYSAAASAIQGALYPAEMCFLYYLALQSGFSVPVTVLLLILPALFCCTVNELIVSFAYKNKMSAAPARAWWISSFIGMLVSLVICAVLCGQSPFYRSVLSSAGVNCLPFCICGIWSIIRTEKPARAAVSNR